MKLAADNPVADVKKPKARKRPVYVMEPGEIAKLRAALDVPWERLLVELAITTGLRSGEIRGLAWDALDLAGRRLFVEVQATRRSAEDPTKTESSVRTVPIPAYLIPQLTSWKLACPLSPGGLVFPGEPDANDVRGPIKADDLLRNILRRARRKAGLPPLRFHEMRHLAGTLMSEAGVPPKRAQEILGHADVRTTLAIYTHAWRNRADDAADRMAEIAGLAATSAAEEQAKAPRTRETRRKHPALQRMRFTA